MLSLRKETIIGLILKRQLTYINSIHFLKYTKPSARYQSDQLSLTVEPSIEKVSVFLDHYLQPKAKHPKLYIEDTGNFEVPKGSILIILDVVGLYSVSL